MNRSELNKTRRWVVKIGSALLTDEGRGLDERGISGWVEQMAQLRERGVELVLVSSGAIAAGMKRLGWSQRPHALCEQQAAAAVGQMGLIQAYESRFQRFGLHTAQILLTHDDLSSRVRYLNARSTLNTLLELGAVPVVNENDTVVIDEIRFGDNDNLAALVANLVGAEVLVILTDQQGMYSADPRRDPDAELLNEVCASDTGLAAMASGVGGSLGRGGMATKVAAAKRAARSGCSTLVASGREEQVLVRLFEGEVLGTLFKPDLEPLVARKRWLDGHLQVRGRLTLDDGAVRVLQESGRSLLAVGVRAVSGRFDRGELVVCEDESGTEIAKGLVNYNYEETQRIMGLPSNQIEATLGYIDEPELIHRDNLVLV